MVTAADMKLFHAAEMKPFHERPGGLRQAFVREFAHLPWGPDIVLAETSTTTAPLYTLSDRRLLWGTADVGSWEYKEKYQDGSESN